MPIGPSTTQTPYLVPTDDDVSFTSILSAGDTVGSARFAGAPDGIGAFDNGDGTMTVLINHELTNLEGRVRAHGSIGSFVDRLVINETTLQVVSESDLVTSPNNVFTWNASTSSYVSGTTAFNRFCSSDLPAQSALFDAATGLGTQAKIYFTGEEQSAFNTDPPEGRPFGIIVTGSDQGKAFELPRLGNMGFENIVLNPSTGARTVAMMQDDQSPGTNNGIHYDGGQVYIYAGDKQATGTDIDKAGLNNGKLYGIVVPSFENETNSTNAEGGVPFTVAAMGANGDVSSMTGVQLQADSEAKHVTEFLRPEDGAWDVLNPNRYYFHTTNGITSPSRLWALDFVDAKDPTKGGTIKELLNGTEGHVMLDNMTVAPDGHLILQEDPGNNARLSLVWDYDPATDTLTQIAEHDPARFSGITPPFTQDEESSGVIDVTNILGGPGREAFLLDTQAHYMTGDPATVEGGQLMLMNIDRSSAGTAGDDRTIGTSIDDLFRGADGNDTLIGNGGNDQLYGDAGNDRLEGGAGSDRLDGGDGDDQLLGGDNGDLLFGGAGADQLYGGGDRDVLMGGAGNDRLDGGDGADQIYGEDGNDVIIGGAGPDAMNGGAGDDLFVFTPGFGADTIYGFAAGAGSEDHLLISGFGTNHVADILARTTDVGGNAVITLDGVDSITLVGVTKAALAVDDFIVLT